MNDTHKSSHSNLILCGHSGSGKTYFGTRLAAELRKIFIDTDQRIEELFEEKFSTRLTCREIGQKLGLEHFRQLEREIIQTLENVSKAIISIGGGTLICPKNCNFLTKIGKLVYLERDKETLRQTIFQRGIPSFLDPQNPHGSFDQMFEERASLYHKASTFKITLQNKTDREVLDLISKHYMSLN